MIPLCLFALVTGVLGTLSLQILFPDHPGLAALWAMASGLIQVIGPRKDPHA